MSWPATTRRPVRTVSGTSMTIEGTSAGMSEEFMASARPYPFQVRPR